MTLRQKLACVGLAVFGLQIASAAAGGAPLRDRLQRWFDPEQLLLASVRMELGARRWLSPPHRRQQQRSAPPHPHRR